LPPSAFPPPVSATRRQVLAGFAATGLAAPAGAAGRPFEAATVSRLARALAARPHLAPDTRLPPAFASLDYDQYRAIRFRPDHAVWRNAASDFRLQMFHRGSLYREPVRIFEVSAGRARPIAYSPDLFRFDFARTPPPPAPGLGFAGFRVHTPLNAPDRFDELAVFLGASYFRAVARGGLYGLSARGLALGTGEPAEEFPRFSSFWIERPAAGAGRIVVHALLESPGVTGAYHFDIAPGDITRFGVTARLYPRVPLPTVGIAPLTSMYLFGPGQARRFDDFRPRVHDSDGLLIEDAQGQRLWRPLANPAAVQHSVFPGDGLRGFGLMQRARSLDAYQDLEARYDLRPSLWVQPQSGFARGALHLVELPAAHEGEDNIAAFWRPAAPLEPGREHLFRYSLAWGADPAPPGDLPQVSAWSAGEGSAPGRRRFVIDYAVGAAAQLAGVEPRVTATGGILSQVTSQPWPGGALLRIGFEWESRGVETSELRLALERDGRPASEIWTYRLRP